MLTQAVRIFVTRSSIGLVRQTIWLITVGRWIAVHVIEAFRGTDWGILVRHANAEDICKERTVVGQDDFGTSGVIANGRGGAGMADTKWVYAVALTSPRVVTGSDVGVVGRTTIDDVTAIPGVTAEPVLTVVAFAVRILVTNLAVLQVLQANVVAVGRQIALIVKDAGIGANRYRLHRLARAIDILVPTTATGKDVDRTPGVVGEGELATHEVPASLQGVVALTASGIVAEGLFLIFVITTGPLGAAVALLAADIGVAVVANAVAILVTLTTVKIVWLTDVVTVRVKVALFISNAGIGADGNGLVLFRSTDNILVGVTVVSKSPGTT